MTIKKDGLPNDTEEKEHSEELPEPFLKALKEIDDKTRIATEALRKVEKQRRKSLLQILDEMDDNIRAAAKAARKAEEAAMAGRNSALAATKASAEARKKS